MAEPTMLRRRVYEVLEGGDRQTWLSRAVMAGLIALILVNVGSAILETVPFIRPAHETLFVGIELVSLVVFGIEYVVRLWVCVEDPRARDMHPWKARFRYALTPAAIIDLVAILPFFVLIFDDADVRTMVLVRLVRLLKLGRYSTGVPIANGSGQAGTPCPDRQHADPGVRCAGIRSARVYCGT